MFSKPTTRRGRALIAAVGIALWISGAQAIPTSPEPDEPVDTAPEPPPEPAPDPVPPSGEGASLTSDLEQQVAGGTPALPGTYGFNARLEDSTGWPFCSGTQIRRGWVVTAAHCFQPGNDPSLTRTAANVQVRIGATDMNGGLFGQTGTVWTVGNIYSHPSYRRGEKNADVALVQLVLSAPNQDTGGVLRMGVPHNSEFRRNQDNSFPRFYPYANGRGGWWDTCPAPVLSGGTILGWGQTGAGTSGSDQLMTGGVIIWNDCAAPTGAWWTSWGLMGIDLDDKLIASGKASSCPGDSGGSVIAQADDGEPFLVGVTGFSPSGCKAGKAFVGTYDVTSGDLYDWINHTIYITENPNQAPPAGGGVDSPVGGPPNGPGDGRPPVQEQ